MTAQDYQQTLRVIAAKAISRIHAPEEWVKEYKELREWYLMKQLRRCSVDDLPKIQGALDENDKLGELLKLFTEDLHKEAAQRGG